MRREFLRGYLLALVAEGAFGAKDPVDVILRKAWQCFQADVRGVAADLGREVAAQGLQVAEGAARELVGDLFKGLRNRLAGGGRR